MTAALFCASDVILQNNRAVHRGGAEGAATPARKTQFFSNIVFEFAELFL